MMINGMRFITIIYTSIFLLLACSQTENDNRIKLVISFQDLLLTVPATGELKAKTSTPIVMPMGVFEPQTIAWLAGENTRVKKGQVVVRFDSKKYIYQSSQQKNQMEQSDIGLTTKKYELKNERTGIDTDKILVTEELEIANLYMVNDLNVFSKNEIIDKLKNKKYLTAKKHYLEWLALSHKTKSESEIELLNLRRAQFSAKLSMFQKVLGKLEVKAPHDGLFILTRSWDGRKTRVGDSVWPGRKIATLPNLSEMQAKLFILESDAANVKINQIVQLNLDAYPEENIAGTITKIDKIAKPITRNSPVKYFEITVSLDKQSSSKNWRPGSQLHARIITADISDTIKIPSLSLFRDKEDYYVRLLKYDSWSKHPVSIGISNNAITQITSGLEPGDVIALNYFAESTQSGSSTPTDQDEK